MWILFAALAAFAVTLNQGLLDFILDLPLSAWIGRRAPPTGQRDRGARFLSSIVHTCDNRSMEQQTEPPFGSAAETGEARQAGDPARMAGSPRIFTRWQRGQIFLASWIGYFAVLLIGCTLRWEVKGWENWEAGRKLGKGLIYTFWHREICSATWFWRKRNIVVMTSQNFDGEYIARIIQRHGYGAARGSSSRGALRALAEMVRCHRKGLDTAFTIDGPRGPRFVAKPGAVLLAQLTGAAILCFHIALRRAYVFRRSWDLFQIPWPFSRAAVFIAPPITVARDAKEGEQAQKQKEVQKTLDDLRARGDEWAAKGG